MPTYRDRVPYTSRCGYRFASLGWEEPWPTFEDRLNRVSVKFDHPLISEVGVPYPWLDGKQRAREQIRILDEMYAAGYRASNWQSTKRFGPSHSPESWFDHRQHLRIGDEYVLFLQPYLTITPQLTEDVAAYAAKYKLTYEVHTRWPFYWPDGGVICIELRAPKRKVK